MISVKQQRQTHIRWMIRFDMPQVLAIENDSYIVPWTEEEFVYCLRRRNCIGMVAEADDSVAGYVIYELHHKRLNILNIAVSPKHRRQRIGSQIIEKLKGKLSSYRRAQITIDIRESNLTIQLFLKSCGFWATKIVRHYYEDTGEDAYHMVHSLRQEQWP